MALRLVVALPAGLGRSSRIERTVEVEDGGAIRLGRGPDLEVNLPFPSVSSLHARLLREGATWVLEDGGSRNGTFVDGDRLPPGARRTVRAGQRLKLADVEVSIEEAGTGTDASAPGSAGRVPRVESTGTIARRLVSDLFRVMDGAEAPRIVVDGLESGPESGPGSGPQCGRQLELSVEGRAYLVGRSSTCDLVLTDDDASREHAEIRRQWDGVLIKDLGSKNGVVLGGVRLESEARVRDGDSFQIGSTRLRLDDPLDRYLRVLESAPEGAWAQAGVGSPGGSGAGAEPSISGDGVSSTLGGMSPVELMMVGFGGLVLLGVAGAAAWLFLAA